MDLKSYEVTSIDSLHGRMDSEDQRDNRWHQIIKIIDLREDPHIKGCFVLLGFAVDEGVYRNHGRIGACAGPAAIRHLLNNLPAGGLATNTVVDAGTIRCIDRNLEQAQHELGQCLTYILDNGGFPVVLGGGHEVTYGHYQGLRKALQGKIGIINFDAHFDIRSPDPDGNSGTSFFQIAKNEQQRAGSFHYLAIGIQAVSNTQLLYERAQTFNVRWISRDKFHPMFGQQVNETLLDFIEEIDHLYITVDMDVFASAFAPGVSAPAYNGIIPDTYFLEVFKSLIKSPKLRSIDFAELNPTFDRDMCTARLAAELIFRVLQSRYKILKG